MCYISNLQPRYDPAQVQKTREAWSSNGRISRSLSCFLSETGRRGEPSPKSSRPSQCRYHSNQCHPAPVLALVDIYHGCVRKYHSHPVAALLGQGPKPSTMLPLCVRECIALVPRSRTMSRFNNGVYSAHQSLLCCILRPSEPYAVLRHASKNSTHSTEASLPWNSRTTHTRTRRHKEISASLNCIGGRSTAAVGFTILGRNAYIRWLQEGICPFSLSFDNITQRS